MVSLVRDTDHRESSSPTAATSIKGSPILAEARSPVNIAEEPVAIDMLQSLQNDSSLPCTPEHGEPRFLSSDTVLEMMAHEASSRLPDPDIITTTDLVPQSAWGPGDGSIRCMCKNPQDNNGFTLQCDGCFSWLHARCYGITKTNIPDSFLCHNCDPQTLQNKKAKKSLSRSSTDLTSHTPIHPLDTEFYEPYSALSWSPEALHLAQRLFPRSASPTKVCYEDPEHSILILDQSTWSLMSHNFNPPIRKTEFKFRIQGDALLETLVASMAYPLSCTDPPTTALLSTLESNSNHRFDFYKRSGIFASQTIQAGDMISIMTGDIHTKFEYRKNIISKHSDPHTSIYQKLRRGQHMDDLFVYRIQPYSYFIPGLDLVIDMQKKGNITRFIRRSCRPNVVARLVRVLSEEENIPESLHIALFARDTLRSGDELFLAFDYNSGNRYYRYHCNCLRPEFCLAEPPFPQVSETTCQSFFVSTPGHLMAANSPGLLTVVTGAVTKKKKKEKEPKIKQKRSEDTEVDSDSAEKTEKATPAIEKSVSAPSTPTRSGTGPAEAPSTAPPSPAKDRKRESTMTREERKLQMYIEAIQRSEEREKRKQQKRKPEDGTRSAPTSASSVTSSVRSSPVRGRAVSVGPGGDYLMDALRSTESLDPPMSGDLSSGHVDID